MVNTKKSKFIYYSHVCAVKADGLPSKFGGHRGKEKPRKKKEKEKKVAYICLCLPVSCLLATTKLNDALFDRT